MGESATDSRASTACRYRLEELLIDTGRRQVWRGDTEIPLPGLSFDLLLELVRNYPNLVTYDQLMAQVWPGLVVSPETVTQRVKLVRDAIGDDARSPRYVTGIRGRGYRVIGRVEALPERADAAQPVVPMEPPPSGRRPSRKVVHALAVGLFLSILLAVVWHGDWRSLLTRVQEKAAPAYSVAVLPFENLTGDPAKDYLADGLGEELSSRLAGVPGLSVSAWTSSVYFKRRQETAQVIGQTLGVRYLLEGSIRRHEDKVRVTAQLVDTASGYHLSSKSYERPLSDVLELQDDISLEILGELEMPVIEGARAAAMRRSTPNAEALDLYLQARYADQEWVPGENDRAIALYERAIKLDPGFVAARVAVADALFARIQIAELNPQHSTLAHVRSQLKNAIAIDPRSADAHAVLATAHLASFDLERTEKEVRIAEGLRPVSERALFHLAQYYAFVGWPPEKGIAYAKRWAEIDPLNPWAHCNVAIAQYHAHRYEDSLRTIDGVIKRHPDYWVGHFVRTGTLIELGRFEEALSSAQKEVELRDVVETRSDLVVAHALTGDEVRAREIYSGLIAPGQAAHFSATFRSWAAVALGDKEAALDALESGESESGGEIIQNLHLRLFSPLHGEPRFQALVRRYGQEKRLAYLKEQTSHLPPWPR